MIKGGDLVQGQAFYINPNSRNILTDEVISSFVQKNKEFKDFMSQTNIELRLLDISYFESFCWWIIGQQISVNVANILLHRFKTTVGSIEPENILDFRKIDYQSIGLSKSKAEYLHNLAKFFLENGVIDHQLLSSNEIREYYGQIRGVGPWTVNMFNIFTLGRMDILAVNDLVVRKGMKIVYNLESIPTIRHAYKLGQNWGDLSTIGTLICWELVGD